MPKFDLKGKPKMKLSNWFRRKNLLSPENAALVLHLNAIDGLDEPRYPNALSDEINNSLNTLIYLTRAAVTILALRREELERMASDRAHQVRDAFERKLFPPQPDKEGLALVGEVSELMKLIHSLLTLPPTKTNEELMQQLMPWVENWLKQIPEGDTILSKIGKLRGSLLVGRLIEEVNAIDALVANVLYKADSRVSTPTRQEHEAL
jgi:hypothetical protein